MNNAVWLRVVALPESPFGFGVCLETEEGHQLSAALGCLGDLAVLRAVFDSRASEEDRREAGDILFEAVLGGELAVPWAELCAGATREDPLRVVLTVEPAVLRSLPWELMRYQGAWLWRRPELLLRRGVPAVSAIPVAPELGPRRVMVVVATPASQEQILAEQEIAALSGVLERSPGLAHVEVLDCPASASVLAGAVDDFRPHVVHFIGHGMPRSDGGSPELSFSSDQGVVWSLAGDDVADLFRWQPGVVVLNACRTAQSDPSDWIGGIAQAFLDSGVRAVISMQADIDSPAAVIFSGKFYEGFAEHRPLDVCVSAARAELGRMPEKTGAWALPVLLMCSEPDGALPHLLSAPDGSVKDVLRHKQYADLQLFVGRSEERRNAWWVLDDPRVDPSIPDRHVLVISRHPQSGNPQTGRTWLANWCLATWFLRGHHIISVDLAQRLAVPGGQAGGGAKKDWLAVLRMIRERAVSSDQLCSLPNDTFGEFNAQLNRLVSGAARPFEGEVYGQEDEWKPFNFDAGHADERKAQILDAFRQALCKASIVRPIVIALDHAEMVTEESLSGELYRGLIRPVAYGEATPLRLVLVAPEFSRPVIPESDSHLVGRVLVGDFKKAHFMRLARAYSSRLKCVPNEATIRLLNAYIQQPNDYFPVGIFHLFTQKNFVEQWSEAARALEVR
ncbi:CHAT domain-containing protein [Streptomyces pratensis]|uniref:CHAT domain-containing protein n=1 Tax=Streptomyces pratensis TaxID=1169025 RepID=UPI00363AFF36